MRRGIIIILIAATIFVVVDTIGHRNEAVHKGNRSDGIVLVCSAWFVFCLFDLVRAVEQRKRDRNLQKYSVPSRA